jgi:hypothetical protein
MDSFKPGRGAREHEPEVLEASGGILEDILDQLGIPGTRSAATSTRNADTGREIDLEVASLRGSLFEEDAEPVLLCRRTDSLAPTARPSVASAPERRRGWQPEARVLAFAAAAGLATFVATGVAVRTMPASPAHAPPAAAALAAGDAVPTSAPAALAAVRGPATADEPAPAPAAPSAQRRSAPRPAAARAAAAVAPSPADTADLPLVVPPSPRPEVAFDRAAAAAAIAGVGPRAAACREAGAGSLAVPVSVTFAPSGSAVRARVNAGPLLGTAEGGCVVAALRGARVPAFEGEPVAVDAVLRLGQR